MHARRVLRALLVLSVAAAGMARANLASAQSPASWDSTYFAALKWRNIGPDRGGRSLAIAGSASRPDEYWFGAVGGGLWKTTDGGLNWSPVTDGQLGSSSVSAVGVAESNPDVVYIGMGETELRGNIMQGDGVYRTADGGKTWSHVGLANTQAIARVRVDPKNPDRVFVAALGHPYGPNPERGVFRTLDGGKTWTRVLFESDSAGAEDLVIDPSNPNTLYASTWQVYRTPWKMWGGGPHSKLFKSTDGGDHWTDLTKNPGMPDPPIGKIGITVSAADPNRLYAIVEANEGGVFRSDDGGKTWARTNDERKIRQRHFYYSRIYADPKDPNTVYALNTSLYRSTDGGKTFDRIRAVPHGDQHDLWIAPNDPQRLASSNDGGGTISTNGGKTWTEQDFPTAQLYHITTTSDVPYHVCGAQQDNSTVCVPSSDWDNMQARGPNHGWYYDVGGGESGYITQSPTDPNVFYAGSQGALLTRYDRSNGQFRDIQPNPRFFSGEPASALPERWQWTFPIVFSPVDSTAMYTTSQHVWKTTDDGQTWKKISPDLTLADPKTLGMSGGLITMDMNGPEIYGTVFSLAPSFFDANTIWAGSDDGLVHVTRDGGAHWTNVTPKDMPKYTRIVMIDASRHDPGTAYVAGTMYQLDDRRPYLWRTHDYGRTWTKIVSGMADDDFSRTIREDVVRPHMLYAGTEHGVYVSWDDGDHWQPLSLNLPNTQVADLIVEDHDLVAGTHGRSIYVLDDIDPLRQLGDSVAVADAWLFQPHAAIRGLDDAAIYYYLKQPADSVSVAILDGGGDVVQRYTSASKDTTADEEEDYFGRGPQPPTAKVGLNRFEWDLTYPGAVVFDSMIIWSARPQRGPMAPPGHYQARLSVNGTQVATRGFDVVMDPRLKGVTAADLKAQFDLAMKIRDRTSAADQAVIDVRDVRGQVDDRLTSPKASSFRKEATALSDTISAIERNLYQVKNRSGQDPLNFPIKLNNRLAALRRSVETGDAKPTAAAYEVLDNLSAKLNVQLDALGDAVAAMLPALNAKLRAAGLAPIQPPKTLPGRPTA